MHWPPIILNILDVIKLIMARIDDIVPVPYASYMILIALLAGATTFLMNLWTRVKPQTKLESAKLKGRGASRLKSEARSAEKAGNYLRAAESYRALKKTKKALRLYKRAGANKQAGELLIQMGRKEEALDLWQSTGNYGQAAVILAKEGDFERAAANYERARNNPLAAEMYEKAGNLAKAAEHYSNAGFHAKAAKCFEKAGSTLSAAKAYRKYFEEQAVNLNEKIGVEREKAIRNLALKSGNFYLDADKIKEAAEIFQKGGFPENAAKAYEQIGDNSTAARLYEEAGVHNEAARLHEDSGDTRQAASSKAEALRSRGDLAGAARAYEEAEDYHMAADLFAQAEMKKEAAEMLLKAGSYMDAGGFFVQAGDKQKGAWAYEHARQYDTAIDLYRETGDMNGVVRVMVAAQRYSEAAKMLLQQKRANEAYKILESIPEDHDDFRSGAVTMAKMQMTQNRVDAAVSILQRGIRGEPVGPETMELYHMLGTLFEQRGDYQLAIDIYTKVLSEDISYKDASARQQALRGRLANTAAAPAPVPGDDGEKTMVVPGTDGDGARGNPRYAITGELGRGGMGVVYKAHDSVLNREVAYKVLPPDLKNHREVVSKFSQEATALAKLLHQNIVTVFDAGGIGGEYYFVMEYIEGRNLKEVVKGAGPMEISKAVSISRQVAEALNYAHSKNVVHRDIKTSNVMIQDDGNVKLMDFGLAKILEGASSDRTGVSGTPYYMSPEQTLGKGIDHRTDIYSLGVMMYELVAGRVPFPSGDVGYHHLHTEPESPRNVNPKIPEALEAIILKAMKKNKEERYGTAAELIEDLDKVPV